MQIEYFPEMFTLIGPELERRFVQACRIGDSYTVRKLLRKKITPNVQDEDAGHTDIVKLLLDAGAQVDALSPVRLTPLHFACRGNFPEVVRLLLSAGCSLDIESKSGYKPADLVNFDSESWQLINNFRKGEEIEQEASADGPVIPGHALSGIAVSKKSAKSKKGKGKKGKSGKKKSGKKSGKKKKR